MSIIVGAVVIAITVEVLATGNESRTRDAALLQDAYCFENAEAIGAAVAGIEAGNAGSTLNGLATRGLAVRLAAGDTVRVTQEGKILRVQVKTGYHVGRYCFLPSAAVPPAPHYMTPAEQERHNREVRSMIEKHGRAKP